MYDSLNGIQLIQRMICSKNVRIDALIDGAYRNHETSMHESAGSDGCIVMETGESIEETWRRRVGQFIVKGWYGADAERKHCRKGVQIIDPEKQLVYWVRMQSHSVKKIGEILKSEIEA